MRKTNKFFTLRLRGRIITGLLVLVPVFVTLWLTGFLYITLTNWAVRSVAFFSPSLIDIFWVKQSIRVLTLMLILALLVAVGEFASNKL